MVYPSQCILKWIKAGAMFVIHHYFLPPDKQIFVKLNCSDITITTDKYLSSKI